MFDLHVSSLAEVQHAFGRLATIDGTDCDEAELLDHITALEKLKAGAAAAQARLAVALVRARTERESEQGVPADRRCQGLAAEIALARRTSPHRGARDLGLAKALVHELPCTLAALTDGSISEWRATLVARETAVLSREHRAAVDRELGGRLGGRLAELGDREIAAEARKIGYRLDPGSALRRTRGASSDRHVSLRPAPDTMTYLSGFLPVAQGVACQAALRQHADALRAQGDDRSRGQIMADTLVERVTGQTSASGVNVEVALVMTDRSLLDGLNTDAHVIGHGPVPSSLARQIVNEAHTAWLRRLFTRPEDGSLVSMDGRRRAFDGELRRFLVVRDQICRTPWCDAPIRHADHVVAAANGGTTTVENGQGLCEACNYVKESAGWRSRRVEGHRHRVEITTPTGHRFTSTAPDPPGLALRDLMNAPSPIEEQLRRLAS